MEQNELEKRLEALETDVALLKNTLARLLSDKTFLTTKYLGPEKIVTSLDEVPPAPVKPVMINKSWANLIERCRDAEKKGKPDEEIRRVIIASLPSRM